MWPILYGVISAVSFGVSNSYWKNASQDVPYPILVVFRGILASLLLGILWFLIYKYDYDLFGIVNPHATILDYSRAVIICLVCSLGLIFFLSSLRHQALSITVPLTSVNVFNILTVVFIVGEPFKLAYYFAFPIAIVGVLFTQSFQFKSGALEWKWNRGATYALLATFFWGITYPLFKFVSPAIGAIPLSFILEACVTLAAIIWALFRFREISYSSFFRKVNLKHYGVLAGLLIGGTLFFNLAIQGLPVLYLGLIGNLQIVIPIIIGYYFYKEHITSRQFAGVLLIIASVIFTQVFI